MENDFRSQLEANAFRCTDSEATFALHEVYTPTRFQSFGGTLVGPRCRYARTLPCSFRVPPSKILQQDASTFTQAKVIDPCYWTPSLPYLYQFESDITLADGSHASLPCTIGLRRWEIDGKNLLLERKRTVLRGVVAPQDSVDLAEAHDAEVAVIVDGPNESFLQEASEVGVMVVANLRDCSDEPTSKLLSFSWQPSVALVLPKTVGGYVPNSQMLAAPATSDGNPLSGECREDWVKAIVVELNPGERPPSELAKIDKPVIAVRRGVEFSNLHEARGAADRLQAELAPEFDLAGYFVAS